MNNAEECLKARQDMKPSWWIETAAEKNINSNNVGKCNRRSQTFQAHQQVAVRFQTICFLVTGCLWPQQGVTGVFHEHHDCAGNYSKCRSFFKWKPITFQSRQSLLFPWGFLCWAISNPLTTFCFTWQPGNLAGSWVWMDFGWFWPSFSTFPYFSHR